MALEEICKDGNVISTALSNEQNYFLSVLRDHIHARKSEAPTGIDWNKIAGISAKHQVTGIVYHQCKNFIPNDALSSFKTAHATCLYSYINRNKMLGDIDLLLNDIDHITVKGNAVSGYYPVPALRTMGDVDIIVREEDKEKALRLLTHSGFENEGTPIDHEWVFTKGIFEIELHHKLLYRENGNEPMHEEYINNYLKYVDNGRLSDSFHLIYLLLHLKKHIINSGVGFRQFLDFAVLRLYDDKIDYEWVANECEKLGLLRFAKTVYSFCEKCFGVESPFGECPIDDGFFVSSLKTVFSNGVFGYDNEENDLAGTVNDIKRKGRIRTALGMLFPSYKNMVSSNEYSFLKGRKYLLPIGWIYRIFKGLFSKKGGAFSKKFSHTFTSSETIEKRNEMYSDWGL